MSKFSKVLTFLSVVLLLHFNASAVSYPPYDFETDFQGWSVTTASGDAFVQGAYVFPEYPHARVGEFVATSLTGAYTAGTVTTVTSPVFNLSAVVLPEVSFDYFADAFSNPTLGADGAVLEYSTDGGTNWEVLNTSPSWYDADLHFGFYPNLHPVWNNSSSWQSLSGEFAQLAGEANVKFRFTFKSHATSTPGTAIGFGFDDFDVTDAAPTSASLELIGIATPSVSSCALSDLEDVSFTIRNNSTVAVAGYSLDVAFGIATFTYSSSASIPAGATVTTANYQFDLESTGAYDFICTLSDFNTTFSNSPETLTVVNNGVAGIATLPHSFNFLLSPEELGFTNGSDASVSVNNGYLEFTGGTGAGWNASSQYTTETQAFDEFTDNVATAYTCNVNATSAATLEVLFDLYQAFGLTDGTGGYKYSWLRVVADGDVVATFNADELGNFEWEEVIVDLDAYANSNFTLTLEASCARTQDVVRIDNLTIREKLNDDLKIVSVVSPIAECGDVTSVPVVVEISNIGLDPQTGFDMVYTYDNGGSLVIVEELYTATLAAGATTTYTFTTPINANNVSAIDIIIDFPADEDLSNNEINNYAVVTVSNIIDNGPYAQDFETDNAYWVAVDANTDGEEWIYTQITDGTNFNKVLAFEFLETTANDWLFSPCLTLSASTDYKFVFDYGTNFALAASAKDLSVYLVDAQNPSATVAVTFLEVEDVFSNANAIFSAHVFDVAAAGEYYLAFHVEGDATTQLERLYIDNISVAEFIPSDLTISALTFDGLADANACENEADVTIVATIENLSGGTVLAGETIDIELSYGTTTINEEITLATSLAAGSTVDYTFVHEVDMSTPGTYTYDFAISYEYNSSSLDNDLANNTATREFTTYGYASALDITGFANICEGGPMVELTVSWTDGQGSGYVETISSTVPGNYTYNVVDDAHEYTPTTGTGAVLTLTVEDANGCSVSEDFTVTHNETPAFTLAESVYVPYNTLIAGYDLEPVLTSATTPSWSWSTTETTQNIEVDEFGIYSVTATLGGCSSNKSIAVGQKEVINLRNGWGYFSSLMDFENANTPEADFHNLVTSGIDGGNVIIVTSFGTGFATNTFTYFPSADPNFNLTNVGDFINGKGYQVKMNGAATLEIDGMPVVPESTTLSLPAGYSFIGYLRQTASPIATQLADIVNNVLIVKAEDGNVYWPSLTIDLIGNMEPGDGFKIYLTAADDLTYTANSVAKSVSVMNERPFHFVHQMASGSNMTIGIPASAWNKLPEYGDEVGVFSSYGELVGSAVYTGGNMAIAVFGNDILDTEKSAMQTGEEFEVRVWSQKYNTESVANFNVASGDMTYREDAVVVLDKVLVSGTLNGDVAGLSQNIPNPFRTTTRIPFYLTETTRVQFLVYNVLGEVVGEIENAEYPAGENQVEFNASNLPSGTYFYRMITDNLVETKQMTIKK